MGLLNMDLYAGCRGMRYVGVPHSFVPPSPSSAVSKETPPPPSAPPAPLPPRAPSQATSWQPHSFSSRRPKMPYTKPLLGRAHVRV